VLHKRKGIPVHTCNVCNKMFKFAHHARRHERYHLKPEDRAFPCMHCSKRFTTKQEVQQHTLIHMGIKNFKCDHCDYAASRKFNLRLHERKHGIMHGDHVSSTCQEPFLTESKLIAHQKKLNHSNYAPGYDMSVVSSNQVPAAEQNSYPEMTFTVHTTPYIYFEVMG